MSRLTKSLATAIVTMALLASDPSLAGTYGDAEELFHSGDFLAAAELGVQLETAAGLALAARAKLAHAEYLAPQDQQHDEVRSAERYALAALAKRSDYVEALLHLAVATSYVAREDGAVVAHFGGLVEKGRGYLDRAIGLDPSNPWALSMMGAWHLEVVRHAGESVGAALYGASVLEGIQLFHKALELDPNNLLLHGEFAISLLALEIESYAEKATSHLQKAVSLTPAHALERLAHRRAALVLAAIESEDRSALVGEIHRLRGMPERGQDRELDDIGK